MPNYRLHYEYRRGRKKLGEHTIKFSAISDNEAWEKAAKKLQEFRESNPSVGYYHVRILKEVRTVENKIPRRNLVAIKK